MQEKQAGPDAEALPAAARNVAGALPIAAGLTYAAGLLVVNIDLAQYGVVGLSLTRAQYIVSGTFWLLPSGMVWLFLVELWGPLERWRSWRQWAKAVGELVVLLGVLHLGPYFLARSTMPVTVERPVMTWAEYREW